MTAKRQARQPVHRAVARASEPVAWPQVDDELLRTLPPVLRAVVRALGFGRARDFLERRGGAPIWVPSIKPEGYDEEAKSLREQIDEIKLLRYPHMAKTVC